MKNLQHKWSPVLQTETWPLKSLYVLQDGGCIANNPTGLGIHECKLLWPDESFQCILSLGNGRIDPYLIKPVRDNSLWQIVKGLPYGFVESATDTESKSDFQ